MDGYELITQVRKKDKKIPITIISNHDDKEKLQKCIPLGLLGYLFKPLDYESIKNYLQEFSEKIKDFDEVTNKISNNISINIHGGFLLINKEEFPLTKLEIDFLELMSTQINRVVTYDAIYECLYSHNPSHSTIKNLVYRLKTKYDIKNIKNIKDIGYQLEYKKL